MKFSSYVILSASAFTTAATIRFNPNDVAVEGPIYAGSEVTIKYSMERAKCSLGYYGGIPTRSVILNHMLNGTPQDSIVMLTRHEQIPSEPILRNLPKGDLAIW
jgi:hypothetical protein